MDGLVIFHALKYIQTNYFVLLAPTFPVYWLCGTDRHALVTTKLQLLQNRSHKPRPVINFRATEALYCRFDALLR